MHRKLSDPPLKSPLPVGVLGSKFAWPAPAALVALFAVMQIVVWTLTPALTHTAPPLDVVEGYMWGREWVLATYKHPAMPSWVLEASRVATGAVGWPAYLASQLFIVTAFAFVFLLGRDMMGSARAAAGTLLLAGITYYAWATPEFNHNVASLPFWAGFAFVLWRAVERRSLVWWVLVGLFAACGLYAKLSTGVLLLTAAAWMLFDRDARRDIVSPGPWVALAVFAVLVTPLLRWLLANDFAPIRYAALRSSAQPMWHIPLFFVDMIANLSGMLLMLVIAGLVGPWRQAAVQAASQPPSARPVSDRAVQYLLFLTAGPVAVTVVGAILSANGLKSAWGSSMFNLIGLLAIALTADRFSAAALKRIAMGAAAFLVLVPLGYAAIVKLDAFRRFNANMRVNWEQGSIADRMGAVWLRETGQSLRIVSGDGWIAGLAGLTNANTPSILTNGSPVLSPWITRSRLEREGMLVVWDARTKRIPTELVPLVAAASTGEEKFSFAARKGMPEVVIGYAIVPPHSALIGTLNFPSRGQ
jgi:4-amino-4-deoxy-L-arabinose transferase-like glycosyltransferase